MLSKQDHKVLIIGGPTGSGESTVTNELLKKYPEFKRIVAATSRAIRGNEKEAINYYYFAKDKFLEEIKKGNILEYTYVKNRDTYYGTYKPELENKLSRHHVIVNVDGVGVQYFTKNFDAKSIFIKPSSLKMIECRIKRRTPDISSEELQKRMENAREEIKNEEHLYDHVVMNDDGKFKECIAEIERILKLEKYLN